MITKVSTQKILELMDNQGFTECVVSQGISIAKTLKGFVVYTDVTTQEYKVKPALMVSFNNMLNHSAPVSSSDLLDFRVFIMSCVSDFVGSDVFDKYVVGKVGIDGWEAPASEDIKPAPGGDKMEWEAKTKSSGINLGKIVKDNKIASLIADYDNAMPLKQAIQLYQPVKSTSNGSIYHVVAMSDDYKMAARFLNGQVSVRIEGKISNIASCLADAGFSMKGDKYASFHVHIPANNTMLACKVIASAIAGTMIAFSLVATNISLIFGKGK